MRRLPFALMLLSWSWSGAGLSPAQEQEAPPERDDFASSTSGDLPLAMSKGVVCRTIDGFERYEPLPRASLTQDEKLQIYYRPLNYRVAREGEKFRIRLSQDGQIRRQGQKTVLRRKLKILEYEPESTEPPGPIFLRNSVPLKGLPPGEYEYDVILRDENGTGPPVQQSLKFRIVKPVLPTKGRGQEREPSSAR